jgi:acetyl-CoA carboxylase, biotin carboxylase subunit
MTIHRMLVANRGEIAVRIVRACRELGIETVLAHSEADRVSLAARLADQTVCIGPPPADKSYLNIPNVVSAALIRGCDALHPGYGFLAENAYLAEVCEHFGLTFVGPPPDVIEEFSNKVAARRRMAAAGVPVVPGSEDILPNLDAARSAAAAVGFPVMLKAAAGGGGRGMRMAESDEDVVRLFPLAQAEAQASFGNGDLYLERLVLHARHIEIQIVADCEGHTLHLGERDCSLQRRHQKFLEEAPAFTLRPKQRAAICDAAVRGAQAAKYRSVGTMEFLVDSQGGFYFVEMNTRIQVEHPVTEVTTGLDLIKLQIAIAEGKPVTFEQSDVRHQGHAIECRIVAEDPDRDFAPEYGAITEFIPPGGPGVRIDSHVYAGYEPPPYYDSLLGKIIAWGSDRDEAIARMQRALRELTISGPRTNIDYQLEVLQDPRFRAGQVDTQWSLRAEAPSGDTGALAGAS